MEIEQLDAYRWRIPRHGKMRVDGVIYADEQMMTAVRHDKCVEQVRNVAHLPGIVVRHWRCQISTGAMVSRLVGWLRLMRMRA